MPLTTDRSRMGASMLWSAARLVEDDGRGGLHAVPGASWHSDCPAARGMPSAADINEVLGAIPCGRQPGALVVHSGGIEGVWGAGRAAGAARLAQLREVAQSRDAVGGMLRLWEVAQPQAGPEGFTLPLAKYGRLAHNVAVALMGEDVWRELAAQEHVRFAFLADTGGDGVMSFDEVEDALAMSLAAWTGGLDPARWASALDEVLRRAVAPGRDGQPAGLRFDPFASLLLPRRGADPSLLLAMKANPAARWRACRARLIAEDLGPRAVASLQQRGTSDILQSASGPLPAAARAAAAQAAAPIFSHAARQAQMAAGIASTRLPVIALLASAATAVHRADEPTPPPRDPTPPPRDPPAPAAAPPASAPTRVPPPAAAKPRGPPVTAKLCYSAAGARLRRERARLAAAGGSARDDPAPERFVYDRPKRRQPLKAPSRGSGRRAQAGLPGSLTGPGLPSALPPTGAASAHARQPSLQSRRGTIPPRGNPAPAGRGKPTQRSMGSGGLAGGLPGIRNGAPQSPLPGRSRSRAGRRADAAPAVALPPLSTRAGRGAGRARQRRR